jgi:uncharacterized protein YqeY
MSIKQQLIQDMKEAMKARESERLGVIRFLLAEIKNAEIDGAGDDDESLQKVVASQVKKTKEAIADFTKAGRDDLVTSEQAKIKVMETYLPAQLSDEELEEVIKKVMADVPTANQGQVIGQVMKQVGGRAEGKRVGELVRKLSLD